MVSKKVVFLWNIREELKEHLSSHLCDIPDLELHFTENVEEDFTPESPYIKDADIIIGWRPSIELLQSAKNMKLYINPGVGVQHLIDMFRTINHSRNITLINGHGNTYFTAQSGVTLLLSLMNKVIPHHNWMVDGYWRRGDDYEKNIPLRDRTVGLLGYGAINSKVHKFLSGFNVKFAALKTSWNTEQDFPTPLQKFLPKDLHQFLQIVDILVVAMPLTQLTRDLIGPKELDILATGKSALVVNISRGPVINEKALFERLKSKQLTGAALDVWYDYKPEPDEQGKKYPSHYPFHELDNIVLSPHRAASPFDDLQRWNEVIENIRRFCSERTDFLNIVDLEREY
ncbi:MAG: NAD(P)-dependent oxidoreductase [Promethearchaeota archaeon]